MGAPGQIVTTEDPELADRFNEVLGDVVEGLAESSVRYAFIGGIASGGLGRPRSTHDIDLFVPPEDSELALRALAKRGFRTEKTDPSWLYKAFKNNILVDVIFKSKGEIYFDQEMYSRTKSGEFHGRTLRLVAPEDLLIIKAAAHSELCPNHWHDATALLSHANLDWPYLIRRARRAPRRVLSLLLYAQSNDIWVPNHVVYELFEGVFGDHSGSRVGERFAPHALHEVHRRAAPAPRPMASQSQPQSSHASQPTLPEYGVSHLRECLAEDARTNELDIQVDTSEGRVLLRGEVVAIDRKEAVAQIARECFPDATIVNQIRVLDFHEPDEGERLA